MSRMFKSIDKTWNVFTGCLFECTYCNARKTAETRLRHIPRYKDGFKPHFVEKEATRTFKPGQFIFIAYMGDISFAERWVAEFLMGKFSIYPQTNFLLCSKDPGIFSRWDIEFPSNIYLGTTIESNRDYGMTKAPIPLVRYTSFWAVEHPHKFISIEPIMDFDLEILCSWVRNIKPDIIEIGADNYHNHLPEPSPEKLKQLLVNLRTICPNVIEKDGLDRLRRGH